MDKKQRRAHKTPDGVWPIVDIEPGRVTPSESHLILFMDLRAVLHDILDQQKIQTRILSEAFDLKGEE